MDGSESAQFEHRLYEGVLLGNPLSKQLYGGIVNRVLNGLTIKSGSPLRDQLSSFFQNNTFIPTIPFNITPVLNSLLSSIPSGLSLPGIDTELGSTTIKDPYDPTGLTNVPFRVMMRGNWQVVFGSTTLAPIPGYPSVFDPTSKELKLRITVDTFELLSFGLDAQIEIGGNWNSVAQFGLADGSKLTGVHADASLKALFETVRYELVTGSNQLFRGFSLQPAGLDLSNDGVDIDLINQPVEWILDAINALLTHLYGGLNLYQAIAKRVLDNAQSQLLSLVPSPPPSFLDFPSEEVYGEEFGIAAAQRLTENYFPRYDILGPADKDQPRTIAWYGGPQPLFPPRPPPPAPLPDTIPASIASSNPAAVLGYAVNSVVLSAQFSFLYEAGGFNLNLDGLDAAQFAGVYPPLAGQSPFSVTVAKPSAPPILDLKTGGYPLLQISGLPVELVLDSPNQRPLRATVNLDLQLEPIFLKCDDCVLGQEASILQLVRNLACLARLGLIQIAKNPAAVIECILHIYAIALRPRGQIFERQVSIADPGTFPQPSAQGQLESLLRQVLPQVFALLVPVPILFDIFHLIPDSVRLPADQLVDANKGWFTMFLPLGVPQGAGP